MMKNINKQSNNVVPERKTYRLIFILLISLLSPYSSANTEFTILSKVLPPFQYYNEKKELTGAAVEIVREILHEVKHPDNIHIYPWARAFNEAQTHPKRILFTTSKTPERESMFKWVGPLFSTDSYLYLRRGSKLKINSLEDAKKHSGPIIVPRSFPAQYYLLSKGFKNLYPQTSPRQSIRMVANGRADIIALEEASVAPLMKAEGIAPKELVRTNIKLVSTYLYIAFSLDTDDHEVSRWQAAFEKVKHSERYAHIAQRYQDKVNIIY